MRTHAARLPLPSSIPGSSSAEDEKKKKNRRDSSSRSAPPAGDLVAVALTSSYSVWASALAVSCAACELELLLCSPARAQLQLGDILLCSSRRPAAAARKARAPAPPTVNPHDQLVEAQFWDRVLGVVRYQLDLCKRAVEENIIVYLGTGCGKTHIAVLLMYELGYLIRKPSREVCIFLAPTIPLVCQQAIVIADSTNFKVQYYHGNGTKNLRDHQAWEKEMAEYEEFYNVVDKPPRVFGMTASPIIGKAQELLGLKF
nr:unnamed protein product [Digitaria exilis]